VYFYRYDHTCEPALAKTLTHLSDDRGRNWYNGAGTRVGISGSSPIAVGASGIIVDSLNADHALMNQESQTADSSNLPHVVISYVPGAAIMKLGRS